MLKKWITLLSLSGLLLTGCADSQAEETPAENPKPEEVVETTDEQDNNDEKEENDIIVTENQPITVWFGTSTNNVILDEDYRDDTATTDVPEYQSHHDMMTELIPVVDEDITAILNETYKLNKIGYKQGIAGHPTEKEPVVETISFEPDFQTTDIVNENVFFTDGRTDQPIALFILNRNDVYDNGFIETYIDKNDRDDIDNEVLYEKNGYLIVSNVSNIYKRLNIPELNDVFTSDEAIAIYDEHLN